MVYLYVEDSFLPFMLGASAGDRHHHRLCALSNWRKIKSEITRNNNLVTNTLIDCPSTFGFRHGQITLNSQKPRKSLFLSRLWLDREPLLLSSCPWCHTSSRLLLQDISLMANVLCIEIFLFEFILPDVLLLSNQGTCLDNPSFYVFYLPLVK